MGILKEPADFIAKTLLPLLPKPFSVCELGDQGMCGYGRKDYLAKDWYKELGCGRYESIDGNGRGTITADLNQHFYTVEFFDLVTDFGTGEHVFDQAEVWRTIHKLTKPGGFIVVDRPSLGYEKHCFYSTNPCLYAAIAVANGYKVLRMEQRETPRGKLISVCYQKHGDGPFKVPQQGRYLKDLVI